MRIPRIYQNTQLATGQILRLDERATHHLLHVLRVKTGICLRLFNAQGGEYDAVITECSKKSITVQIGNHLPSATTKPLHLHLAQGMARGQKMDLVIQKAVELGVQQITPILTERSGVKLSSERWQQRHLHWQGVIISACEQCGRCDLPSISTPQTLPEWLNQTRQGIVLAPEGQQRLRALDLSPDKIDILIGPEGGLSEQEISLAQQAGLQCVGLGPRVLRTETAALAVIAAIQQTWGDF